MIAEIQVLPQPPGTPEHRYRHVDAAIAALRSSGLRVEVGALGTTIEGSPDAVWAALRRAHEEALRSGADGLVTVVKLAEAGAGGTDVGPGIDDLVGPHR